MRLHRFIRDFDIDGRSSGIQEYDEVLRTIEIKDPHIIKQIRNVFRLKIGDELILCDGNGTDARVRITTIKARTLEVYVESLSKNESESPIACLLYCAVLKKDSFEWVVQKATEVGVTRIVPLITKRTVKSSLSSTRLNTIAREAAEQSGRGSVPMIVDPILFEQAIHDTSSKRITLFCDPSGSEPLVRVRFEKEKSINLFIGPEGGWDPYELDRARISGAQIVSLGKTILRAETAAIVASYMAVNL